MLDTIIPAVMLALVVFTVVFAGIALLVFRN